MCVLEFWDTRSAEVYVCWVDGVYVCGDGEVSVAHGFFCLEGTLEDVRYDALLRELLCCDREEETPQSVRVGFFCGGLL